MASTGNTMAEGGWDQDGEYITPTQSESEVQTQGGKFQYDDDGNLIVEPKKLIDLNAEDFSKKTRQRGVNIVFFSKDMSDACDEFRASLLPLLGKYNGVKHGVRFYEFNVDDSLNLSTEGRHAKNNAGLVRGEAPYLAVYRTGRLIKRISEYTDTTADEVDRILDVNTSKRSTD